MNEQVKPKIGYPAYIFDKFIGLTNLHSNTDNMLLAKVYVVSLILLANLPKPILLPHVKESIRDIRNTANFIKIVQSLFYNIYIFK